MQSTSVGKILIVLVTISLAVLVYIALRPQGGGGTIPPVIGQEGGGGTIPPVIGQEGGGGTIPPVIRQEGGGGTIPPVIRQDPSTSVFYSSSFFPALSNKFLDENGVDEILSECKDEPTHIHKRILLSIMRNEMYARHGRKFENKAVTDYFAAKGYKSETDDNNIKLTTDENAFVTLVKKKEDQNGGALQKLDWTNISYDEARHGFEVKR